MLTLILSFLAAHFVAIVILVLLLAAVWYFHGSAKNVWAKEKAQFLAVEVRILSDLNRAKQRIENLEHELAAYRFGGSTKAVPRETPAPVPLVGGVNTPIPPDASKIS